MRVKREDGSCIEIGGAGDQIYTWNAPTGEQFHWSVLAATAFAQARNDLVTVSLSDMGITPPELLRLYPDIDPIYALTTDITQPLLFVPIGKKVRLIDGSHRVMKALLIGIDVLPAYFLTQEEADDSLILTLPPGKTLEWGNSTVPDLPPNSVRRSQHRR